MLCFEYLFRPPALGAVERDAEAGGAADGAGNRPGHLARVLRGATVLCNGRHRVTGVQLLRCWVLACSLAFSVNLARLVGIAVLRFAQTWAGFSSRRRAQWQVRLAQFTATSVVPTTARNGLVGRRAAQQQDRSV